MNWSATDGLLSVAADIAAIATAMVAVMGSSIFLLRGRRRKLRLESLLRRERALDEEYSFGGKGERTILFIMAQLAMSETQVRDAAFASRKVKRWLANDDKSGRSTEIYFQYDVTGGPAETPDYIERICENLRPHTEA